eukprot:430245-Pleurochrysis_carterae.AAC.1
MPARARNQSLSTRVDAPATRVRALKHRREEAHPQPNGCTHAHGRTHAHAHAHAGASAHAHAGASAHAHARPQARR